jgi:hypothetical protein
MGLEFGGEIAVLLRCVKEVAKALDGGAQVHAWTSGDVCK